ncbi:hypothetical protein EON66_07755 [archaeon]|nr:MAG: hypothetical protein EON66_07755 [archaeon]
MGLYAEVFERRKEYGIAVFMSRHPGLNASIHEVLFHTRSAICDGLVECIVLVILDATGTAIEQYSFQINVRATPEVPATYADVEAALASALLRLGTLEATAPELPRDATFTIMVQTHSVMTGAGPPPLPAPYWAQVDDCEPEAALTCASSVSSTDAASLRLPVVGCKPIKHIALGGMIMNISMERGAMPAS